MPLETVLVTGGAGFIGSTLCRMLAARGSRVVVYDSLRFGASRLEPRPPGLEIVEADIRDGERLAAVLRESAPRVVFHLAALHYIPYCDAHPEEARDVNLRGTQAVLEACARATPERVVFISTGAVYPVEGGPLAEEHPTGPLDVYGETKLLGEDLARRFAAASGVPTIIARLFNAFGPGETNPHLIPELVTQLAAGSSVRLGNLDPVRDYIHVLDVASALTALADHPGEGCRVFNVGSGEGRSVRDVVTAFETALGRRVGVVQEGQRIRKVERPVLVANVGKLCRETGWRPRVGFDEGIRELAAGLR